MMSPRSTTTALAYIACGASIVHAQSLVSNVSYQFLGTNITGQNIPSDSNAAYSSLNALERGFSSGSSNGQPPSSFTLADDFLATPAAFGLRVQSIRFVAWNAGSIQPASTPAILQMGFWNADGPNGVPGTYHTDQDAPVGFLTSEHVYPTGFTLVTLNLGDAGFLLGDARLWVGVSFKQGPSWVSGNASMAAMGYAGGSASPSVGQTLSGAGAIGAFGIPFGSSAPNPAVSHSLGQIAIEFVVPSPGTLSAVFCGALLSRKRRRV